MHILFVVPYTPNLIRVRPYQLIRSLMRRGHRLTVATLWTSQDERADLDRLAAEGVAVVAEPLPRWRSAWNCLAAAPRGAPLQSAFCWQPALARRLDDAVRTTQFDVAHVEHLRGVCYGLYLEGRGRSSTSYVPSLAHTPPVVWDSVDCISHLFEQAARSSRSSRGRAITWLELGRTRRYEGWLAGRFGRVVVTSPVDRDALLGLTRRTASERGTIRATPCSPRIDVLPNGVDLDYFSPSGESREPATVVITGKMSYHANITAALHLVDDIMPRVWAQRPDVRVCVVGKDPSREVRALPSVDSRVVVAGTVPDIRPYLRRATLAVAPVPYGAGIQNKVLEALACATPVVASPQAVSALAAQPGRDLVLADGAEAFARALLALLDDPPRRQALGLAGRAYVQACHDWGAVAACLERIYLAAIADRHIVDG